jgi:hypothetical protein
LERPCRAIDGYAFAGALEKKLKDPWLKARRFRLGSIDQVIDWSDELSVAAFTREAQALWLKGRVGR